MAETFYSGPGKVYWKSPFGGGTYMGFQPADANGEITSGIEETTVTRGGAMYGDLFEVLTNQEGKTTTTPFDNWGILQYVYPTYIGVSTAGGTNAGVLAVGTNPFDPTAAGLVYPAGIYGSDGTLYNYVRSALTKHPTMKFHPGEKLFGSIELSHYGLLTLLPGQSGFIMSTNTAGTGAPITETGATDPDTTGWITSDFGQTHWTAAWGAISGFVGMEAEDGWDLVPDVRYNFYKVQGISRLAKLASARFMIKGRIVGGTHTQILAKVLAHTSGGILTEGSATDFVLTGSNGKTVTLKNAEIKGFPYSFGGTKLRAGEIGFVQQIPVTGVPAVASASLLFSS